MKGAFYKKVVKQLKIERLKVQWLNKFSHSLLFITLLLLQGCAAIKAEPPQKELKALDITKEVFIKNSQVHYLGKISKEKQAYFFKLVNNSATPIKSLYINSLGGDVQSAINIANWVYQQQLDVYIDNVCMSSCANYILPAGKNKYLSKNSLLVWHGSSFQENIDSEIKAKNNDFSWWRKQEIDFFNQVKVSPLITVCGFDSVSFIDHFLHYFGIKKLIGFTYSIEDLQRFGVSDIKIIKSDNTASSNKKSKIKPTITIVKADYCKNVSWQPELSAIKHL